MSTYATPTVRPVPTAAGESTCCIIVWNETQVQNPACGTMFPRFPTCSIETTRPIDVEVGPISTPRPIGITVGPISTNVCTLSATTPLGTLYVSG